jgi:hypothetical protein
VLYSRSVLKQLCDQIRHGGDRASLRLTIATHSFIMRRDLWIVDLKHHPEVLSLSLSLQQTKIIVSFLFQVFCLSSNYLVVPEVSAMGSGNSGPRQSRHYFFRITPAQEGYKCTLCWRGVAVSPSITGYSSNIAKMTLHWSSTSSIVLYCKRRQGYNCF